MPLTKKCIWYLTLVYDVIFGISGFIFICLNSLILYNVLKYKTLIETNTLAPLITHIVAGFFYIVLSWCGWKVAFKVHLIHVKLYGVLLVILLILEVCCLVWLIHILHNNIKAEITKNIENEFSLLLKSEENAKVLWDKIQSQMNCCGVGGPTDYRKSNSVPWSCCQRIMNDSLGGGDCSSVYQHGCLLNIYDEVRHNFVLAVLCCVGMIIVQAVGVAAYFSLAKSVKSSLNTTVRSQHETSSSQTQRDVNETLLSRSSQKY